MYLPLAIFACCLAPCVMIFLLLKLQKKVRARATTMLDEENARLEASGRALRYRLSSDTQYIYVRLHSFCVHGLACWRFSAGLFDKLLCSPVCFLAPIPSPISSRSQRRKLPLVKPSDSAWPCLHLPLCQALPCPHSPRQWDTPALRDTVSHRVSHKRLCLLQLLALASSPLRPPLPLTRGWKCLRTPPPPPPPPHLLPQVSQRRTREQQQQQQQPVLRHHQPSGTLPTHRRCRTTHLPPAALATTEKPLMASQQTPRFCCSCVWALWHRATPHTCCSKTGVVFPCVVEPYSLVGSRYSVSVAVSIRNCGCLCWAHGLFSGSCACACVTVYVVGKLHCVCQQQ